MVFRAACLTRDVYFAFICKKWKIINTYSKKIRRKNGNNFIQKLHCRYPSCIKLERAGIFALKKNSPIIELIKRIVTEIGENPEKNAISSIIHEFPEGCRKKDPADIQQFAPITP